ncbi:MAG: helix-turn-helix transcriptional regulator [Sulfurospirillum sp.]|nr:helix-turn-helix transcriptional regulator [Sulfurospirillum sp.]
MSFDLLNDEQIIVEIGKQIDILRREKKLTINELAEKSGVGTATLTRVFSGKGNISLKTLIAILRGVNDLDKLENVFVQKKVFSPLGKNKPLKKRIHKKEVLQPKDFTWGEDIDE